MSDSYYDVAQICTNGHIINGYSIKYPQYNQEFCSKCGAPTITNCRDCDALIRGHINDSLPGLYEPPLHCHECGKPYPWTGAVIKAAQELADMADNLTDEERENLKEDIGDMVSNAPRAPAAAYRANRLATKAAIKDGLISIFSNIASGTLANLIRGW